MNISVGEKTIPFLSSFPLNKKFPSVKPKEKESKQFHFNVNNDSKKEPPEPPKKKKAQMEIYEINFVLVYTYLFSQNHRNTFEEFLSTGLWIKLPKLQPTL